MNKLKQNGGAEYSNSSGGGGKHQFDDDFVSNRNSSTSFSPNDTRSRRTSAQSKSNFVNGNNIINKKSSASSSSSTSSLANASPRSASITSSPKIKTKSESRNRSASFIKRLSFKFKSSTGKLNETSDLNDNKTNMNYNSFNNTSIINSSLRFNTQKQGTSAQNIQINDHTRSSYCNANNNNSKEEIIYKKNIDHVNVNDDKSEQETNLNIETMRKVFNVFDSDHDGSITIKDVEQVMNSLQYLKNEIELPSVDQIRVAFDKFDSNRNGSIEFEEFLNILKSAALQSSTQDSLSEIKEASIGLNNFNNNNNNNSSNFNELDYKKTTNFNNLNSTYAENTPSSSVNFNDSIKSNMKILFEQFDKDHDGKITRNELSFVMCNLFPDETITENDITVMLHAADLDNNGFIDFDEFANMFKLYSTNNEELMRTSNQPRNSVHLKASNKSKSGSNSQLNHTEKFNYINNNTGVGNLAELSKSNKSLSRTLSRSNSKEDRRIRTQSQTSAPNKQNQFSSASNSTFKRVVQIFTSSQMMDLKAAFTMFDKNGDQKISESELQQAMKYLGVNATEKEVKAMIKVVDKNGNGCVDYDEFIQMMTQTHLKPLSAEDELRKTFNIFDIDGNGFISADEIKKTMAHLGEKLTDEEVNDMVKAADKNGDGKIDLNEFSGLLSGTNMFESNK